MLCLLSGVVLCCVVLCCVVLCCVVLCCAVLCCVMLRCVRCVVLCCAVLCCVVLCCVVLCCVVLCFVVLCCAVLCCVVLCCVALCCVALRCVVLCCVVTDPVTGTSSVSGFNLILNIVFCLVCFFHHKFHFIVTGGKMHLQLHAERQSDQYWVCSHSSPRLSACSFNSAHMRIIKKNRHKTMIRQVHITSC